jgi:hypothetical protein
VADPLHGVWLKVGRAREHLKAFQAEFRDIEVNPYRLVGQYEGEGSRYVVRFSVLDEGRRIPRRFGLMVGDVVHNLRTALDHLAWQLAIIGSGPGPRTQFPIFEDADEFRKYEKALLHGIAEGDRARIRGLQPYEIRVPTAIVRDLELNRMLMILGRLDNVDKHSIILPAITVAQFREPTFSNLREAEIRSPGLWHRVEDGAVFAELINPVPIDPFREVHVETEPAVTIVFGEPIAPTDARIWTDRRFGAMSEADLFAAVDAVEKIISRFVSRFP